VNAIRMTVIPLVAASLVVGGAGPWSEYASVVRSLSGVAVLEAQNMAPAAQLAMLVGMGEPGARTLYLAVAALAGLGTVLVAWRVADDLASLAVAVVLSLVILPITWYHYAAALIPIAVAAVARSRGTSGNAGVVVLVGVAFAIAVVSVAALVAVWLAVGAVVAAVFLSTRRGVNVRSESGAS